MGKSTHDSISRTFVKETMLVRVYVKERTGCYQSSTKLTRMFVMT